MGAAARAPGASRLTLLSFVAIAVLASAPKVLVLPPEPVGTPEPPTWIAEAVADVLPRDLERLGVPVVDRAQRLTAHEALDIPVVRLTRATSIRLAEALGVTRILTGTYEVRHGDLTMSLRWLDVERGTLTSPFLSSAPLTSAPALLRGLAWDVVLAGPWKPSGTRDAFVAGARGVPFPAFEAYGMGLAAGKPATRLDQLRRALKLHPSYDEARVGLAREEIEARDYEAAFRTLEGVADGSPLARLARFLQGVALLELGRFDEAGALQARLAAADATPGVLSNHGLAALRAGESGPGSARIREALAKMPGATDVAFNLGWALLVEGEAEAAAFWLRGLTRQAPRDVHARVALSWALRRAGRVEEAAEEWRGVALMGAPDGLTETPDLTRRLGRVMLAEWPTAIERSDTDLALAHVARADALLKANDFDGALRELTRAAYLDPYSARAHELLARAHLARGEKEKAISELQMSLWCREDTGVRVRLAKVLADAGRLAEAQAEAQKVLSADPGNAEARAVMMMKKPSDI